MCSIVLEDVTIDVISIFLVRVGYGRGSQEGKGGSVLLLLSTCVEKRGGAARLVSEFPV